MSEWSGALGDFDPKRDFALAMLHAEKLIKILTDVAIADVLLEQAQKHPERRELLERWLERSEPRSRHQLDLIQTTGGRILDMLRGAETPKQEAQPHQAAAK